MYKTALFTCPSVSCNDALIKLNLTISKETDIKYQTEHKLSFIKAKLFSLMTHQQGHERCSIYTIYV